MSGDQAEWLRAVADDFMRTGSLPVGLPESVTALSAELWPAPDGNSDMWDRAREVRFRARFTEGSVLAASRPVTADAPPGAGRPKAADADYGICSDCRSALAVRTTWQAETGSSVLERFCPGCGLTQ